MAKWLKRALKKILPDKLIALLREVVALLYYKELSELATFYGTDKGSPHSLYTDHYTEHFKKLRTKKLKILEIGVGGGADTMHGGASLRMWREHFYKSMIYSIDIYDKSVLQKDRIKIFQGSQADETFLRYICSQVPPLDIIIDDGSHMVDHILTSFKALFPFLKDGGVYVIEDSGTSYWPEYGGE